MKIIRNILYSTATRLCLLASLMCLAVSCLVNDIPYPTIQAAFLSIEADGQTSPATINTKDQVVTLHLAEQTNMQSVKIKSFTLTEEATISSDITTGLNLTEPVSVVLSLYQDYTWQIKADQYIDRYFTVASQVGASIIDVPAKRVVAYVPKSADLTNVQITSMKLGPAEVSTYTPALEGTVCDFSTPLTVKINYHTSVEEWTIYVENSDEDIQLSGADAWTRVIWVYGNAEEGKENTFEYRRTGDTEWTRLPQTDISHTGGAFSACIKHLQPLTSYDVRAISGELASAPTTVTTDAEYTVPNLDFNSWWLDGKVYNPWVEGETSYWDTGNKGATTLGASNSVPSTDTWNGKPGYSAQLDTKFIGLGVVGKLGAGNIFTGEYRRTDGTNGILGFGRPFTGRPTKLHGYFKYRTAPISHSNNEYEYLKGQPDTAHIYIVLAEWSEMYEIRTNPSNRQLLDRNSDKIIATGDLLCGRTVDNWTEFTITLNYRSTSRKPTYILIAASASKYGDFFTGGDGATLFVDDFSLEWDY